MIPHPLFSTHDIARRTLPLIMLLAAGCADPTGDAADAYQLTGYLGAGPIPVVGSDMRDLVRFTVWDARMKPVPGVELRFTVRGDATLEPTSAVTDQWGSGWTRVTVGQTPGEIHLTAALVGRTDSLTLSTYSVRRNLVLSPDSWRMLVGCGFVLTARLGPAESFYNDPDEVDPGVRFELTDSSVVELQGMGGTDYRRAKRVVIAEQVGSSAVIASFGAGVIDTAHVEVLAPAAEDSIPQDCPGA